LEAFGLFPLKFCHEVCHRDSYWAGGARVAEELKRRGVDAEALVVDFLVGLLKLDPQAAAESHLELAVRYLEEGGNLADRNPVQASEKLYRAAEEAVKALATYFDLRDILEGVERSGRWSAGKLGKAVFEDFREGGIERMVSEARRIVEKK
jgi:hypothetical protein